MTTPDREQREQIRRDAEAWQGHPVRRTLLALLDALEQAEQRRDEAITTAARAMERAFNAEARAEQAERERDKAIKRAKNVELVSEHHQRLLRRDQIILDLEARLAAVPALVEALYALIDVQPYLVPIRGKTLKWEHKRSSALDLASEALTAYQETTK